MVTMIRTGKRIAPAPRQLSSNGAGSGAEADLLTGDGDSQTESTRHRPLVNGQGTRDKLAGSGAGTSKPDHETPWSRELIKAIAMDVGKEIAAYIEVMYPMAVEATSSTFLLSVRNSIYNEIMAAIDVNDAGQIEARLKERKRFRREWKAQYKRIRSAKPIND